MALQKGTLNGVPIVEDSAAVGTPVADIAQDGGDIVAGVAAKVALSRVASGALTYPSSWLGPTPEVFTRHDGVFQAGIARRKTFFDTYSVKSTTTNAVGKGTYWVSQDGSDSNGGKSPTDALLTINAALAKSDVLTVMLKGGEYHENSAGITKSVNIIGWGTERAVYFRRPQSHTFSVNATYPTVWELGVNTIDKEAPCSARLFDENGIPVPYTKVASIQAVSETPMSYYLTSDQHTLYVHASAAPVIGTDIYAGYETWGNELFSTASDLTNVTLYMENVTIPRPARFLNNSTGTRLHCWNCAAVGTEVQDPWTIDALFAVVMGNCFAVGGQDDGFNYNGGLGETNPYVMEINCQAYNNGVSGGGSDQASTAHDDLHVLRINGEYESAGQNCVLDVGTGQTINLGVRCSGPAASKPIGSGASRETWCFDCFPAGYTGSHYLNDSSATMHISNRFEHYLTSGTGSFDEDMS